MKPFHRFFWHIKFIDVDRNSTTYACEAIEGTMKIHSICGMNKNWMTQFLVEALVCFYVDCLNGQWECCLNLPWIGDWIPRHLMPIDNKFIKKTMLDNWDGHRSFGIEGDDLVAMLEIADNFVVNVKIGNVEGVDFYLICCNKPLHII
jgi:hypothetical protein